jgi:hypothetical protein
MNPFIQAWTQASPLLIALSTALIIILAGFILAKAASMAISFITKTLRLDLGLKKVGFSGMLEKGNIRKNPADLLGDIAFWTIIFVTIIGVANVFALPVDMALNHFFSYLGLVFLAGIILGLGLFFASLISGIVRFFAANFGLEGSKTLANVIYYIVIIFSFIISLAQLGISPEIFTPQIGVIIGAVGLAAAIAFGLGCKDMAADFLHNLFKGK